MTDFSFHAITPGYTHVRQGLECQDAAGSEILHEVSGHAFAVADGHGDPTCTRSALGSKIAVEATLAYLHDFALEYHGRPDLLLDKDHCVKTMSDLGRGIVRAWRERVRAHYEEVPPQSEEWESLGDRVQQITLERPERLYGTTLVAGLILPEALLLLQQGDGCCVVMDGGGNCHRPMPDDPRCVGNVTTSLCDSDADESVRYAVLDLRRNVVSACFVGSDGVDKSLRGTEGLFDFCEKIALDALDCTDGLRMRAALEPVLADLSRQGSGDDVSMAGYVNTQYVSRVAATMEQRRERYLVQSELDARKSTLTSMQRMHDRYVSTTAHSEAEQQERDRFMADYDEMERAVEELEQRAQAMQTPQSTPSASVPAADVQPKVQEQTPQLADAQAAVAQPSDAYVPASVSEQEVGQQPQPYTAQAVPQPQAAMARQPIESTPTAQPTPMAPEPRVVQEQSAHRSGPPLVIAVIVALLVALIAGLLLFPHIFERKGQQDADFAAQATKDEAPTPSREQSDELVVADSADEEALDEDLRSTIDNVLNDADKRTEESEQLEAEVVDQLAMSDPYGETDASSELARLHKACLGKVSYEYAQDGTSGDDDSIKVKVTFTCPDATGVLDALSSASTRRGVRSEEDELADDDSIQRLQRLLDQLQGSVPQTEGSVTITLYTSDDADGPIREADIDKLENALMEKSGYLACLRYVAGGATSNAEDGA